MFNLILGGLNGLLAGYIAYEMYQEEKLTPVLPSTVGIYNYIKRNITPFGVGVLIAVDAVYLLTR